GQEGKSFDDLDKWLEPMQSQEPASSPSLQPFSGSSVNSGLDDSLFGNLNHKPTSEDPLAAFDGASNSGDDLASQGFPFESQGIPDSFDGGMPDMNRDVIQLPNIQSNAPVDDPLAAIGTNESPLQKSPAPAPASFTPPPLEKPETKGDAMASELDDFLGGVERSVEKSVGQLTGQSPQASTSSSPLTSQEDRADEQDPNRTQLNPMALTAGPDGVLQPQYRASEPSSAAEDAVTKLQPAVEAMPAKETSSATPAAAKEEESATDAKQNIPDSFLDDLGLDQPEKRPVVNVAKHDTDEQIIDPAAELDELLKAKPADAFTSLSDAEKDAILSEIKPVGPSAAKTPELKKSSGTPTIPPGVSMPESPVHTSAPENGNTGQILADKLGLEALSEKQQEVLPTVVSKVVKETVKGMMQSLRARNEIKSAFRMNMTMIQAAENNPLKFSVTPDDALENMFTKTGKAYLPPVESIVDGFADIADHQIALFDGMRSAYDSMLEMFNPEKLEERFNSRKGKNFMGMRKGKNWESYQDFYQDLAQDKEDTFKRFFGEIFAEAYERRMHELKTARKGKTQGR
ncbi:MAG: type VI secretion system-associated FHA domain protein TagH, partial [Pseudomonadales bacterium]|nr:type VI secretion system-associated FHA domain protein TagH [Pseudomonadales bacterium]